MKTLLTGLTMTCSLYRPTGSVLIELCLGLLQPSRDGDLAERIPLFLVH